MSGQWPMQRKKQEFKKSADSLTEVRLAKIKVCQDTVPADFEIDPRKVSLQKVLKTSMGRFFANEGA